MDGVQWEPAGTRETPTNFHGDPSGVPREPMVSRGIPWVIPIVSAGSHVKATELYGMPWGPSSQYRESAYEHDE